MSRFRPWYLPGQIVLATVLVCVALQIGALGLIWLWPHSVPQRAQHFDYRFGLKERISTALEVLASALPVPVELRDRQLQDAVGVAEKVNVRTELPVRLRWLELVALIVLIILLVYLLLLPNPKTDELLAQREFRNTVDAQIDDLENMIERIESNPELSEAEQQALTDPLNEALDILHQDNVSQQEAVAALAEAQQALDDLSDGMTSEQESAYERAASEVAGSEMTSDLAEALDNSDLGQTADALEQLAQDIGEQDMTQQERDDLADRLEAAAAQLEESNPALAEKLREAAQALRDGDTEAAQQALREAAELLDQQQEQLDNSEMAQAAQDAQVQVQESQQELAGSEQGEMPVPQTGQSSQQQQSSESGGQAGSMSEQQQQQMQQSGQMQQSSESQSGEQTAGQSEGAGAPDQSEDSQGQGMESSENASGGVSGASDEQSAGQPDQSESSQGGGQTEGGTSSMMAGQGEGGEGSDTTTGDQSSGEGGVPQTGSAEGDFEGYDPSHAPTSLGGESDDIIDVGGDADLTGDELLQEGELGPNPAGESTLTYSSVFGNFRDIISDALESGRIPLDQRDVIHDYFSSLDQ